MKMSALWAMDYDAKHLCGHPLRLHMDIHDMQTVTDKSSTEMTEIKMSLTGNSVSYFSGEKLVTHCPGCGQFLPDREGAIDE